MGFAHQDGYASPQWLALLRSTPYLVCLEVQVPRIMPSFDARPPTSRLTVHDSVVATMEMTGRGRSAVEGRLLQGSVGCSERRVEWSMGAFT